LRIGDLSGFVCSLVGASTADVEPSFLNDEFDDARRGIPERPKEVLTLTFFQL
jgi:hypothetical protein